MSKRRSFQRLIFGVTAAFLFCLFLVPLESYGSAEPETEQSETERPDMKRPDIIMIDLPAIPGGDQMPAVQFFHDLHTQKIKGNDCSACHLTKDKAIVFKFKRIEDTDTKTDMAVYHDNCIGCHVETAGEGKESGPITGECRACHSAEPKALSSRLPIPFDHSLHNRHERSTSIVAKVNEDDKNCSACHHEFNEETQKLVYKKGEEGSCRYCHKPEKQEKVSSMQSASHNACVACHLILKEQYKDSGPLNCMGCHDLEEQKKIKKVEVLSRIPRNQPDQVLMTGWDDTITEPEALKKAIAESMKPVAFNHLAHEEKATTCRACHHETLKSCESCHSDKGEESGDYIKLGQAMHLKSSLKSCIGCHDTNKVKPECAGCHSQMPEKRFADNTCTSCHMAAIDSEAAVAMDKTARAAFAKSAAEERLASFKPVAKEKIPETIKIGYLSEKYEPSEFPHGAIIKALETGIEKSTMAKSFHGDGMNLCKGCHHNSPASDTPLKCASCHGKTRLSVEGRPGLKSAYHGQCIACHDKMNMDKIAATDCNKCHKEKK